MNDMWISDPRVSEAMTKEYGQVDESTPMMEVIDLMLKNSWEEVLVIDKSQNLVGLVTKEHLVSRMANGVSQHLPIKEISCINLITTKPEEDLSKARDVMRRYNIGRLPVIGDKGNMLGILTAKDVCNGFSAKLERQGEQLCAVMENIVEAIQVVDCDGIVSFWNNGAEKLFGIKAGDIMGKKLGDYLPGDLPLQALTTAQSFRNIMCELRTGVYVVRHAVPVVTPSGETIGAVCTTVDVSQMKALMNKLEQANNRVKNLERLMISKEEPENFIFYTVDDKTQKVLAQARRVGQTDATVMIQGQSGTGKEMLANIICRNSKRAGRPLIEVNCSAIPEALFESEMFGYEAGAFTGGKRSGKPGKFEMANGGTIFLDEVGELPLDMQAKLLRVIQERRFYRVGGTNPIEVDVRLIAATNRDISTLVLEGKFREDLYYRLNVVILEIPSLEMRKCDILGLVDKFLRKLSRVYEKENITVERDVMELLVHYDWPGNVRQLQNMLENIVILMEGDVISIKSLSEVGVLDLLRGIKGIPAVASENPELEAIDGNLDLLMNKREREVINKALRECSYNKASAAKLLGIPRSTLYYKIRTLKIEEDSLVLNKNLS
jgi:PAS domain S-box-containing protein